MAGRLNLNSARSDRGAIVSVGVDDYVSVGACGCDRRSNDDVARGGERCRGCGRDRCVDDRVLAGTAQRDIASPDRDDGTGVDGRFVDRKQATCSSRGADGRRSCDGQVSRRGQFDVAPVNVRPDRAAADVAGDAQVAAASLVEVHRAANGRQ